MSYKNKTEKEYAKEYRQRSKCNKTAWYTKTYGRMKRDNKNKFKKELPFSKDDFVLWVKNQEELFDHLFEGYIQSNFDKYKNPSVDRIDDYKGYSLNNIQLLTWEENNKKGRDGIKNKKQCSDMAKEHWSKKTYVYDDGYNLIYEFESAREAARFFDYENTSIARACRNKSKYREYYWRYEKYE